MAVTICVWAPAGGNVGHAALKMGPRYLSFWPSDGVELTKTAALLGTPGWLMTDLSQDIAAEGGHPHFTTTLNGLDEGRIGSFIDHIKRVLPSWRFKGFNCSDAVKIALYEGTGRRIEPKGFAVDAGCYLPPEVIGSIAEPWARATWNPLDVHRYAEQIKRQLG